MGRSVKVFNAEGNEVVEIYSIKRDGGRLIIDGKALGVMRMDMTVSPNEVIDGLRMIFTWDVISFILLLPYFMLKKLIYQSQGT